MDHPPRGFTMQDGNYQLTRWLGDVHKFSLEFLTMVPETQS